MGSKLERRHLAVRVTPLSPVIFHSTHGCPIVRTSVFKHWVHSDYVAANKLAARVLKVQLSSESFEILAAVLA